MQEMYIPKAGHLSSLRCMWIGMYRFRVNAGTGARGSPDEIRIRTRENVRPSVHEVPGRECHADCAVRSVPCRAVPCSLCRRTRHVHALDARSRYAPICRQLTSSPHFKGSCNCGRASLPASRQRGCGWCCMM